MSTKNSMALGAALLFAMMGTAFAQDVVTDSEPPPFLEHSSACAEEPALLIAQAQQPPAPESGEVQERAVPRLAPGASAPGLAPMTRFQGGVMQGNRLQADPGYVLEPLPGNKVALKPKGGGPSIEANCLCRSKGGCAFEVVGPTAFCKKSTSNACTTNCILTVGGKLSGSMAIQ